MAERQPVAEFSEDAAGVFRSVGTWNSVMQMDLDFSPASVAVIGEHLEQPLGVLSSGIEVGVNKRALVVVSPAVDNFGIFAHPGFQAALLLGTRDAFLAVLGIDGWLEMISQGNDQMHGAAGGRVQRTPSRGRKDLSCVGDLSVYSHLESGHRFPWFRVDGEGARRSTDSSFSWRLAATHGDGELANAHVLHTHRSIPFEHLLVGMLGLILRRIPVEGVEHAGFPIFLAVHPEHVMDKTRGWTTYQGHALQCLLKVVEERDRNFQNAEQDLGLHLLGIAAPKIAQAVPLV